MVCEEHISAMDGSTIRNSTDQNSIDRRGPYRLIKIKIDVRYRPSYNQIDLINIGSVSEFPNRFQKSLNRRGAGFTR